MARKIVKTYEDFDNTFNQYGIGMGNEHVEICKELLDKPDYWVYDIKKLFDAGKISAPVLNWLRAHLLKNKQALKSKTITGKIYEEVFSFIMVEKHVIGFSIETFDMSEDKEDEEYPFHILNNNMTYYILYEYADGLKYDIEKVPPTRDTLKIEMDENNKPYYAYENKVMSFADIIGNDSEEEIGKWIKISKEQKKYTVNPKSELIEIPKGSKEDVVKQLRDQIKMKEPKPSDREGGGGTVM